MRDVALYIHYPFCQSKCGYCDFYSITSREFASRYLNALQKEIDFYQQDFAFAGHCLSTLYLGGGTPSLLGIAELRQLLSGIATGFAFDEDIEITCEANPGTLTAGQLTKYRKAGVNRLSLGVQSFIDQELKILERIHSAQGATNAIGQSREAGFDNLGLDLIFGIPYQSLTSWQVSLEKATEIRPQHISMYGLTIEKGTPLACAVQEGKLAKCDEEQEREMYLMGKEMLESAGYDHYEISNFALPGFRSRHNQKYWDGSPFLSLGPSAHSFDGEKRWWNVRDVNRYCNALEQNALPIDGSEILTNEQNRLELIMLGLRRREGMSFAKWQRLTGGEFLFEKGDIIAELGGVDRETKPFSSSAADRLLTVQDGRLSLTCQGLLLYDSVCARLCQENIGGD
jgi:oxygen-independent coproporphyrinogen-3 oxidase